ncbi:MAG: hypothetical protein DI538_04515 [Azospira oryzae]|jgi:hypothetical protein|nr:MAG: hypothetical protein DI538_04515 [Azospira oryzae]
MKKDIDIPEVSNVTVAIAREKTLLDTYDWKVYLINRNDFTIENAIVASTGYGEKEGEQQKTSTLRHFLENVSAKSSALIEPIQENVFHLNNEYWVSYYVGGKIHDKRFVFVPDSICEANLSFIKELDREGVLHS